MPTCMSIGCANVTGKCAKKGISLHRIPADPVKTKLWLTALRRADIDAKTFKPTKFHAVCSEHFNETDFDQDLRNKLLGE